MICPTEISSYQYFQILVIEETPLVKPQVYHMFFEEKKSAILRTCVENGKAVDA